MNLQKKLKNGKNGKHFKCEICKKILLKKNKIRHLLKH